MHQNVGGLVRDCDLVAQFFFCLICENLFPLYGLLCHLHLHVDPKKQHTAFNYYPLFFSSALQFVLTLDDGLVKTKRDEIHVF